MVSLTLAKLNMNQQCNGINEFAMQWYQPFPKNGCLTTLGVVF